MRIEVGQQFKERGARSRIFAVVEDRGVWWKLCSFTGGSKRRGESRTVLISSATLRKRFTAVAS